METLFATSNIANKVRNTRLPRTKPLMPLFELISNSIHSIEEAIKDGIIEKGRGKIIINCIRNGSEEALKSLQEIDRYPIHSFEVIDNGVGLNPTNFESFKEADSDHKIEIGGKGVGRFVCLKAFQELKVKSQYFDNNNISGITFNFRATKQGFHNLNYFQPTEDVCKTSIILSNYRDEYQRNLNPDLYHIATEIVSHFQLYFIRKQCPEIIVRNQNDVEVNLLNLFKTEFKSDVQEKDFELEDVKFTVYLTKSLEYQSHKIHYCAHNRSVISESLFSQIIDLGKSSIKDEEEGRRFYYQAFVVSDYLDHFVDTERIGFDFPNEKEDDDDENIDLNLAKIRKSSITVIEEILAVYLTSIRTQKVEAYKPIIMEELPQYRATLNYKRDEVLKLPPDLPKDKLDIELYKIDAKWRVEVKEMKSKLLDETKDISNLEEYKHRYESFLSEFNEIGQADLARYVVHRKTVIDLLEKLIEYNSDSKFENEDLLHNVFFPIKSSSDEITPDKQNLWLIDERLTYHSFLASDKTFNSLGSIDSGSADRSDLFIYNEAFAFSDTKSAPHNSFTIVEFKKPMRNDYKEYDSSKNPIEQSERYIENLLSGKVKGRNGRNVEVTDKTPFYVYIVCDVTPTLERILKSKEYDKTPDDKGWFKVKSKYYSAYFEVLPFEKVLDDARKRNRILFEKLNIE